MATYQYTQLSARTELRVRIDEPVAAYFADQTLNNWINEGALIIARKTLCLRNQQAINLAANVATGALPADTLQVDTMELAFTGSQQVFTLEYIPPSRFKYRLGVYRNLVSLAPVYWSCWSLVPSGTFTVYPTPTSANIITCTYFRQPSATVNDIDNLDLPLGWQDLAIDYAHRKCLLTVDRIPDYQIMMQEFNLKVNELLNVINPSDQNNYIEDVLSYNQAGEPY